jgi:hypothetical protein
MHTTGMSFKAIGHQLSTGLVANGIRLTKRCNALSSRSDVVSWQVFHIVGSCVFSHQLADYSIVVAQRLSTRTVRHRLKSAELKSRRIIKRPLLVDRHRRTRLAWCLARRGWNIRTWRKIHCSDESRFPLHVTDGRMRIWRHKNTAYIPRNIQPTVPYGGGSVMVWGCISHDCKLDLVTIQGNLTGDQYIRDVLDASN